MRLMSTSTPRIQRPPGPRIRWWGLPLLRQMRRDYLGLTGQLAREHGDLTYMRLGHEHAYDIFHPDMARALLVDNADALVRWERGIEVFEEVFGASLLVTEGDVWKRQRRMLAPAFSPKRIAGYGELMVQAACDALDRALPPGVNAKAVRMDNMFSALAMDVIMRTMFSSAAPREAQEATAATQVLSATAFREMFMPFTLPNWLPLPGKAAKRAALASLRGLVGKHIAAQRGQDGSATPKTDLLTMLLALRDDTTGEALADQEVFDQCMVTFQAGHETSATALLWWSHLMAQHPEVQAKAAQEVGALLGSGVPNFEAAAKLPYLQATLKEAMRLFPPVAAVMSRRATRDIALGGFVIPKGSMLRITPWHLHRDARSFPEPTRFLPERFVHGSTIFEAQQHRSFMPFGAGPRVCIGQHFAMLEMTLVAALVLQRFELRPLVGAPLPEPELHVTLRPKGGIALEMSRRTFI